MLLLVRKGPLAGFRERKKRIININKFAGLFRDSGTERVGPSAPELSRKQFVSNSEM